MAFFSRTAAELAWCKTIFHTKTPTFLLNLFNMIFREGTVPSTWKEAVIISILKLCKNAFISGNCKPLSPDVYAS